MFAPRTGNAKARILDVSIDLISIQGYAETSMREIAAAAGLRASSLYNHFPSKYDIMLEILRIYESILQGGVARDIPFQKKHKILTTKELSDMLFFRFPPEKLDQYRKIQKILYSEHTRNPDISEFLRSKIIEKSFGFIRSALASLSARGLIPPLNVERMSALLYTLPMSFTMLNTMDRQMLDPDNQDTSMFALIDYLLQMILDGKA